MAEATDFGGCCVMYEGGKVYGPYTRKQDKRQHVIIVFSDRTKKTVSYPKYLVEEYLGRYLEANETVDHIDGDFTNNTFANLRVVDRSVHAKDDVLRVKDAAVQCVLCGKTFVIPGKRIHNRERQKAGPFCSRRCSGMYGTHLQNGRMEKLSTNDINREYFTRKSLQSLQGETLEVDIPNSGKPSR